MIDRTIARRVASDLLAMANRPDVRTDDGKSVFRLIVDRIAEGAESEGHAVRAVRSIVDHETFFPPPSVIMEALDSTPRDVAARSMLKDCPICHGDAWISLDGPYGLSCAVPCKHDGEIPTNLGLNVSASLARMYLGISVPR